MTKKLLFLVTVILALAAGQLRAQNYCAVYDEDNTTMYLLFTMDVLSEGSEITFSDGTSVTLTSTNFSSDYLWDSVRGFFHLAGDVTKVVLEPSDDFYIKSCEDMFQGLALKEIKGLEYLKTESTKKMFYHCYSLTSLDLTGFDTSNVTDMSNMFEYCSKLESITFGDRFDTSNVTDFTGMFNDCSKLQFVDLSKAKGKIADVVAQIPATATVCVPHDTDLGSCACKVYYCDNSGNITFDNLTIDKTNKDGLYIPRSFKANSVTIGRSFTAGKPSTIYVPFAMSATDYGTFYEYKEVSGDKVIFSEVTETAANTPYLFIPKSDYTSGITLSNVTGAATTSAIKRTTGLIGVYEKLTFDETNKANCYGWANGEFKKAGNGASVLACRAYIKLPAGNSLAPARLSISLDGDDDVTAIDAVSTEAGADAPMYNLQGQRVSRGYKGVVIRNGKKMIIK